MGSQTDYFESLHANDPKPKYQPGDRVFGHWNKIPFIASVVREENKSVLVQVDLPVKHNDTIHNILRLARTDIKLLKEF